MIMISVFTTPLDRCPEGNFYFHSINSPIEHILLNVEDQKLESDIVLLCCNILKTCRITIPSSLYI